LVVDVSASLDFGSIFLSKREVLTELSSLLAFSATRNSDKVGLLLFSDRVEKFVPPAKGRKHILRIIRDILFHEPQSKNTDLIRTISALSGMFKKRAIVFLLSDFLQPDLQKISQLTHALEVLNRRHDLVCLKVEDARERELLGVGPMVFEDAETGEILEINTSARKFQKKYKNERDYYGKIFSDRLKKVGIDLLETSTEENYFQALDRFLKGHAARK
jgi:uncharacterized protein (DUF58 family)